MFEIGSTEDTSIDPVYIRPVDDYIEVKTGADSESGYPELMRKGDWSAHYGGWKIFYTTGMENESETELKLKFCLDAEAWTCSNTPNYGIAYVRVREPPC